mmetsp:Transcript_13632/g.35039  ORF Transcript_13632/g.35039 Transcript_13632/m.35039 type:complete len:277 (+) Transcript_13632:147-977(+)
MDACTLQGHRRTTLDYNLVTVKRDGKMGGAPAKAERGKTSRKRGARTSVVNVLVILVAMLCHARNRHDTSSPSLFEINLLNLFFLVAHVAQDPESCLNLRQAANKRPRFDHPCFDFTAAIAIVGTAGNNRRPDLASEEGWPGASNLSPAERALAAHLGTSLPDRVEAAVADQVATWLDHRVLGLGPAHGTLRVVRLVARNHNLLCGRPAKVHEESGRGVDVTASQRKYFFDVLGGEVGDAGAKSAAVSLFYPAEHVVHRRGHFPAASAAGAPPKGL